MASSRMNAHLKKSDLKKIKCVIEAHISSIQAKLDPTTLSFEVDDQGDEVDAANRELIQRTHLRFSAREAFFLKKLEKSLALIDEDEYGMCEDCGGTINFTRLMARPTSTMCIGCKEEAERDELQSSRVKTSTRSMMV